MEPFIEPPRELDALTGAVIGAAIEVHSELGPGFLESIYEAALAAELRSRRVPFDQQVELPIFYRDALVGTHRLDLLVGGEIVVELKAVAAISDTHLAQTLSYLKAGPFRLGLILNFNVSSMRSGIKRVIRPL